MIEILTENNIGTLIINNPPMNVLSCNLIDRLRTHFLELTQRENIRAIIITNRGKVFCAGADVNELSAIKTFKEGKEFAEHGRQLMDVIENSNIPVIAAINGACIGGGNELAMACHLRIASENAWFAQPEINLGIIPGFGGTQRLPKLIGRTRAIELILTGERITATEALDMGLLNKVVHSDLCRDLSAKLMIEAMGIANKIAKKGRIAITACLKAVYGLEDEENLFGKVCETVDKNEGIQAFIEKREAVFKDR